jgi:ribosomal protein S18 acetylase RimI-like enzyme
MTHDHFAKLDNPAWWALKGVQRSFSTGFAAAKRYRHGILPFIAYDHALPESIIALNEWLEPGEAFFLIGDLPHLPSNWELITELPCAQMILPGPAAFMPADVVHLAAADRDEMFDLVNRVQPGYYEPDTHQLGNYYGIRQEGRLVAIAGERIRLEGFTEVSAICTDPAYTGRGYAQQLTAHVCRVNLERGITPFLHVLQTNQRAIRIYEYLGFRRRRVISFWKLKKS